MRYEFQKKKKKKMRSLALESEISRPFHVKYKQTEHSRKKTSILSCTFRQKGDLYVSLVAAGKIQRGGVTVSDRGGLGPLVA